MKRLLIILPVLIFATRVASQQKPGIQQRVDSIIRKMTLDEKIGQMTQVTLAVVARGGGGNEDGALDEGALKKAIVDYKVGSIINATAHALSVAKWGEVQRQIQDQAKKTRLQIPVIYGLDGIHGQTYTLGSTLFPQNIAMAATRNSELAAKISKVTAK